MLKSIYEIEGAGRILYDLLAERTPEQSISHKEMPSYEEHRAFINSKPYLCWYIIYASSPVGAIYLTKSREIGIGIFSKHKSKGYGTKAVKDLISLHPGKFLANINPDNFASRMFFMENFKAKLIQETFECSL
jgi:predicted acetyltransferase